MPNHKSKALEKRINWKKFREDIKKNPQGLVYSMGEKRLREKIKENPKFFGY